MNCQPRNTPATFRLGATLRERFPIFGPTRSGKRLVYLDSAATTQKPDTVIERIGHYLSYEHANVHRGAYGLSATATAHYNEARERVARFLGAPSARSIVFTSGTTSAINLAAYGVAPLLKGGEKILTTVLEHHSNFVPWQQLAQREKLSFLVADVDQHGVIKHAELLQTISLHRPRIVAITALSNALGTSPHLAEIIEAAHRVGAWVFVDAAQAIAHQKIDVQALDVDLLAFSGHKLYGPTGIGVLYGKEEILEQMHPMLTGGGMIQSVTTSGSQWTSIPEKFEAGTPPIAEAIGLGTAVEFFEQFDLDLIQHHEHVLFTHAVERLRSIPGLTLLGPIAAGLPQHSILSFTMEGVHAHDISTVADSFNIQIRAGHHCTMPLHNRLGIDASARISFGLYSDLDDIEVLHEALLYAHKLFQS